MVKSLENCAVLGFDVEWTVPFLHGEPQRNVAILQLCSNDDCLIVQLCHMDTIPDSLRSLLENESVTKVGVGIAGDCSKLSRDYNLTVNGVVDVSTVFRPYRPPNFQLATLSMCFLGKTLLKPSSVRFSDWEAAVLSDEQILYAATDAFAGLKLYERSKELSESVEECAPTIEVSVHTDEMQIDYQRVCLDAFHFMDRYPVSKLHPLYATFLHFLREALFIVDDNDLQQAKKVLKNRGMTQAQVNDVPLRYLLSKGRVARRIPKVCIHSRLSL